MSERYTLQQIREYWTSQAVTHGQAPAASWSDHHVIDLEIREILRRLRDGDRVLDVGCANGYSTVQFAAQRCVEVHGIDYVAQMIEQARLRLAGLVGTLAGTVDFEVGDARTLKAPDASYDAVVVIRVIINLGDWATQRQALRECSRVLRSGGHLLLSEATLQGWNKLNAFRHEWGLPKIPMPPFNQYLDEERVVEALAPELELVEIVNFASTYYVWTRVLKPLIIQALGASIDVADPNMEWNRWGAELPTLGNYGTQKLFFFTKA
jgi:ubiquinone/menaquinone biosynthesis C-methylase UbiE